MRCGGTDLIPFTGRTKLRTWKILFNYISFVSFLLQFFCGIIDKFFGLVTTCLNFRSAVRKNARILSCYISNLFSENLATNYLSKSVRVTDTHLVSSNSPYLLVSIIDEDIERLDSSVQFFSSWFQDEYVSIFFTGMICITIGDFSYFS